MWARMNNWIKLQACIVSSLRNIEKNWLACKINMSATD